MSERLRVPPRPRYRGDVPSQAELVDRNQRLVVSHRRALDRVQGLAHTQETVGRELTAELSTLKDKGHALDDLERELSSTGLVASLLSLVTRRNAVLERRSATEALVDHYELVSVRLRRASAFTDELRLCALELQAEVDGLHEQFASAMANEKLSAERILAIENALAEPMGEEETPQDHARRQDALEFELRQETLSLELFRASAEVARHHLEPSRALRDTTQRLHEEMATFTLQATGTVNAAGRRIQALGLAADAPLVVGELQQSLEELQQAMDMTTAYIEQTRVLITDVLPELSARLAAQREMEEVAVTSELDQVCLLYTSPSPRDATLSRMPSSA